MILKVHKKKRLLVLEAVPARKNISSYLFGFSRAFPQSTVFDATVINLETHNRFSDLFTLWDTLMRRRKYDAVILLHSIFASGLKLPLRWRNLLRCIGVPIVYFVANEYYRMPAKMDFARDMDVSLLISQCLSEDVLNLYRNHLGCKAIGLPNTGFNEDSFEPGPPIAARPVDIGYRMVPGPPSFGHWEREDIALVVEKAAKGRFVTDISLRWEDRFGLKAWANFLQNCKTQLSVASGGDIFELTDKTLLKAVDLVNANPEASREEIATVYPPLADRIPLRTISSRMVEAAATKTPQIMYPEDIGIPLEPDIDYIALEKDHSNLKSVMDRVADYRFLETIAQNCFEKIREHVNYERIFCKLDSALDEIL